MIPKNGRLSVRKGQLTLENNDSYQRFRRFFNKDSRDQTLIHLKNTIQNAIELSNGIKNQTIQTDLKEWTLQCLLAEMQNCRSGLINLKTTYCDDYLFQASIDVINERLQAHCFEFLKLDSEIDENDKKCKTILGTNPSNIHEFSLSANNDEDT
jgi:hypothetical protein